VVRLGPTADDAELRLEVRRQLVPERDHTADQSIGNSRRKPAEIGIHAFW
jgi:hypothetical protein